jgi:hypothetical protein
MEKFRNDYDQKKSKDNFAFADQDALRSIIRNLKGKIKEGKLYKGKAGENLRIYTCRVLESFAMCSVPLEQEDIIIFKVVHFLYSLSSRRT